VGASFVDSCAENYAHWISEVLPRIALFCSEERFHGIPIIVNAGLHKNIMSSLFLLAGDRHEIKALPIGRALIVEELHLISVTGYVPFGQRKNKLSGHSHGKFSPLALKLLRDSIHTFVGCDIADGWPEKIYISRKSGSRIVTNETELEMELAERGYVTVEPGVLTFLQQVNLFSNAKMVLATTGAALSNAVFCMPKTQVAILMAKHEQMIYRYWCDMLVPTGIDVSYVLGEIIENTDLGIHADFEVDMDDVRHLLNTMEGR
jgi:capsular polysaccharide biosynthesis protein